MSETCVNALRSVDLTVTDLAGACDFFTRVWHLEETAAQDGIIYFRAGGPYFHVLSLRRGTETALVRVGLQAQNREAVGQAFDRIRAHGLPTDGAPRALSTPAGGYGFGFRDPEGRNFALVCEVADHAMSAASPDRPTRLSHVNLNCRDNDATFGFMSRVLGFGLSDQTRQFRFVRCNTDHHALVLGFNDNCFLNHIAFEMPDLDGVMRGIGRMRDHGYPVEWGPGRHGPGNNVFAYFCGPEEMPLEIHLRDAAGRRHISGRHAARLDLAFWSARSLGRHGWAQRAREGCAAPVCIFAGRLQA